MTCAAGMLIETLAHFRAVRPMWVVGCDLDNFWVSPILNFYEQVGPLRPVAWFKFHTRQEAKGWAAEPVTVWEGKDPELENPIFATSSIAPGSSNFAGPIGT